MELLCGALSSVGLPAKVSEAFVEYLQLAREAGDGSKDVVASSKAIQRV